MVCSSGRAVGLPKLRMCRSLGKTWWVWAEKLQCREGTAAVTDVSGSWNKHHTGNLISSAHVELLDHMKISSIICAQQVQGVQGALNIFTTCCLYSLKVTKASLWDLGMLSACCKPLCEGAHWLQSPSPLFLETLGRNLAITKTLHLGRGSKRLIRNCFLSSSAKIPGGMITREALGRFEVWQYGICLSRDIYTH